VLEAARDLVKPAICQPRRCIRAGGGSWGMPVPKMATSSGRRVLVVPHPLTIKRALERDALKRRNRYLERDLFKQHDFGGIITRDPRMR
jgi:hypothetical protein